MERQAVLCAQGIHMPSKLTSLPDRLSTSCRQSASAKSGQSVWQAGQITGHAYASKQMLLVYPESTHDGLATGIVAEERSQVLFQLVEPLWPCHATNRSGLANKSTSRSAMSRTEYATWCSHFVAALISYISSFVSARQAKTWCTHCDCICNVFLLTLLR